MRDNAGNSKRSIFTADTDLLKMVSVKIWLNFGNHFRTIRILKISLKNCVSSLLSSRYKAFLFYRSIRFDQSPERLIPLKNRQEPLNSAVYYTCSFTVVHSCSYFVIYSVSHFCSGCVEQSCSVTVLYTVSQTYLMKRVIIC